MNFFLSFLRKTMIDNEFHIVYVNQSTILPEFCPPRCWVLSQDPRVSECPEISPSQKSPPSDSVAGLWTPFDDAFVAIRHLKKKKQRLLV